MLANISPLPISQGYQSTGKGDPLGTGEPSLMSLVTIIHNRLPIDSPVLRSTMRGMRIAYTIRDADQSGRNDHHCLYDKECLWFRRKRSESLI